MKLFPGIIAVLAFLLAGITPVAQVKMVDAPGLTVKDMNASVKFYSEVLGFKKISDDEYAGEEYEKAVVPDQAKALLKRFDKISQHYELVISSH